MGTDISLHVERRVGDRWVNATELLDVFPRSFPSSLQYVTVCSWPLRRQLTGLFFGPEALFPFQRGIPRDLCDDLQPLYPGNFAANDTYAGWMDVDALCLELWESESVLLGAHAPASLAACFGAGETSRPALAATLAAHGLPASFIDTLVWTQRRVATAEDWSGWRAHELSAMPPHRPVAVTWRETIADFAGAIWTDGLERFLRIPGPRPYRLVTSIG